MAEVEVTVSMELLAAVMVVKNMTAGLTTGKKSYRRPYFLYWPPMHGSFLGYVLSHIIPSSLILKINFLNSTL